MSAFAPFDSAYGSRVYGAGVSTIRTLPYDFANKLQQALEEKAKDEAVANDPKFAQFCLSHQLSDVPGLIAATLKGSDDSYWEALRAAERIAADWITFRVGSMLDWEREEIATKLLEDE